MKKVTRHWPTLFVGLFAAALAIENGRSAEPGIENPNLAVIPKSIEEAGLEDPRHLSFDFVNKPVLDALREIGRRGRVTFIASDVIGSITLRMGPVSGLEALHRVARDKDLVVTEGPYSVYYVETREDRALHVQLQDPELKRKFMRLVRAEATRAQFDELASIRYMVGSASLGGESPWDELFRFRAHPGSLKLVDRVNLEVPLARTIVIYRISYLELAVVFFGNDDRLRYYYLARASGLSVTAE